MKWRAIGKVEDNTLIQVLELNIKQYIHIKNLHTGTAPFLKIGF